MMGQGQLFGVLEIENDLVEKICEILDIEYEGLFTDHPQDFYEIDEFVCDAVRDYIRRYWK